MTARSARAHLAIALVLAVSACGVGDSPSPSPGAAAVRDSAGVRIVENGVVAPARWTVDAEPTVVVGASDDDPDQALFGVVGATVLEDGRVVVATSAAPLLRWFDVDGRSLLGTGRQGGGPGEFAGEGGAIYALWRLPGDSVATWEHGPRRMQVFGPDGAYVRSVVLDAPAAGTPGYPQVVGRWDAGFVAFLSTPRRPGALGEVVREPLTYLAYDRDGRALGPLASLPGFTIYTYRWDPGDGERNLSGQLPLAGRPVAWVAGERFVYSSADSYEITARDVAGSPTLIVRQAVEPRPLTQALIDAHIAERMEGAPDDPDTRRKWREMLEDVPYPETLPAFRALRVDRSGTIWAAAYPLPGSETVLWWAFDHDGTWLAEVEIPTAWTVLEIGPDHLLVVERDELDVETVRRYRLHRG